MITIWSTWHPASWGHYVMPWELQGHDVLWRYGNMMSYRITGVTPHQYYKDVTTCWDDYRDHTVRVSTGLRVLSVQTSCLRHKHLEYQWMGHQKYLKTTKSVWCFAAPLILLSVAGCDHPSCSLGTSSAVGGLPRFQSDGPGVGGHSVAPSMDTTGVNTLVELVGN